MKVIVREHPEVLGKIIYQVIKGYAKTQEKGITLTQIDEALSLVRADLVNFASLSFPLEAE